MYDQLAKQVAKILEETKPPVSLRENLAKVTDLPGLLHALFDVEWFISDAITHELAKYDTKIPISAQENHSESINRTPTPCSGCTRRW
jgi:hypothetical protein